MSFDCDGLIEDQVKIIVAKHLSVSQEKIISSANFVGDLGADSFDTVEIVMALEEEFGIDIPDKDIEHIETYGDVIDYLKSHASIGANLLEYCPAKSLLGV